MSKTKKPETTYADTAQGALKYLKHDSSLNLEAARCYADPQVAGVWKIVTPKDEHTEYAIVYLAGYEDPWGRVRTTNDFECCSGDGNRIDEDDEDDLEEDDDFSFLL